MKTIFGFTVKQFVMFVISVIIMSSVLIWYGYFSPWARYNPTDRELYEMAVEYDMEHGTDYSSMYNVDPNWYNEN